MNYRKNIMDTKDKSDSDDSDVIVIDNNENINADMTIPKIEAIKHNSHERKRKVKFEISNNIERLVVTQKVKVKKQKIQCIINLTNICETKRNKEKQNELRKKFDTKINRSESSSRERIVPHCLRSRCRSAISSKCCRIRKQKRNKSRDTKKIQKKRKSATESYSKKLKYLSPISLSPLHFESDLSYENISSGSLSSDDDENLNTLIRRARDREKQSSKIYDCELISTKTAKYIPDIDNLVPPNSDTDVSIHSAVTLVLEQQPDNTVYSPTYPTEDPINLILDKQLSSGETDINFDILTAPLPSCVTEQQQNKPYTDPTINPVHIIYPNGKEDKELQLLNEEKNKEIFQKYLLPLKQNVTSKIELFNIMKTELYPSNIDVQYLNTSCTKSDEIKENIDQLIPYSPTMSPTKLICCTVTKDCFCGFNSIKEEVHSPNPEESLLKIKSGVENDQIKQECNDVIRKVKMEFSNKCNFNNYNAANVTKVMSIKQDL